MWSATNRTDLQFSLRWSWSNCEFFSKEQVLLWDLNLERTCEHLQPLFSQTFVSSFLSHNAAVQVAWSPRLRRVPNSRQAKGKESPRRYKKVRLQSDFRPTICLPTRQTSTTLSAFNQRPTSLARMGSSYITPRAPFCPGAYPKLSKPYRFGLPFPSILCFSFISLLITQLRLHPRLVPPCPTARHIFRWHWIHLILVLLRVLRWYSLAKRIATNFPRTPIPTR